MSQSAPAELHIFHAFPTRMPAGFISVDVFFIISAYLITTIILRGLDPGTFSFAVGRRRAVESVSVPRLLTRNFFDPTVPQEANSGGTGVQCRSRLSLVSAISAHPSDIESEEPGRLTVRTYRVTAVSSREWNAVVRGATDILDRVGIEVEWIHWPPDGATVQGSAGIMHDAVPSQRSGPADRARTGFSGWRRHAAGRFDGQCVDTFGHPGDDLRDDIERLSRQADVCATTVMARAIAHELGHLLLGTSTHSAYGLMRPRVDRRRTGAQSSRRLDDSRGGGADDAPGAHPPRRIGPRRSTNPALETDGRPLPAPEPVRQDGQDMLAYMKLLD